jgi:hypothetical protein
MGMKNKELIEMLRENVGVSQAACTAANLAADRIEELVKERDTTHEAALREAANVAWVYGFEKQDGIQKRILSLIGET